MKFNLLTLFPSDRKLPQFIDPKIAQDKQAVQFELHDFREHADNKHKKVDDTPYGGGAGMVLQAQPIYDCIQTIRQQDPDTYVIYPSPRGQTLTKPNSKSYQANQASHSSVAATRGSTKEQLICVSMKKFLGDFIFGGELPSLCIVEGVTRLLPEVLGNQESHQNESFGKLEGKKSTPCTQSPKNSKD